MIALIVAYARNRVIGNKGCIPWKIKGEQIRFKELTMGKVVIMGRKSFEEIGKPLPNRTTIVVSSTKSFEGENCYTASSLQEAIELAGDCDIYISGGARLYAEAIDLVDKMYITEIEADIEGDTFFPDFAEELFDKEIVERFDGEIPYTYVTYTRKNMTEKVLYVTDLDGTLLTKQDSISPFSIQTINELVEKGMLFTYATARSLVSASKVTKGLSTNIPIIAYNGAFIFQPSTGEILSKEEFTEEERNRVKDVINQHQISPLVYSFTDGVEKVSWIPQNENEGIRRYLSMRQGDKRLRAVADTEALYEGDMFYFTCIGEKDELQPIYDIFSNDDRYRCTMQQELYRPEYWCEIMPALATKANAIRKLKEMWGCTKVISFGDAINDIPMFEISDECYAVANAVDELKAVATGIIESNEDDGVAKWLINRESTM